MEVLTSLEFPQPCLREMKFQEMTVAHRLSILGNFHADTSQFTKATESIIRLYESWQTAKDGHILILHGDSGVGKTTVIDQAMRRLVEQDQSIEHDASHGRHDFQQSADFSSNGPTGRRRPVAKVFVEPMVRKRGFLRGTLQALGVASNSRDTYGELMERLKIQIIGQGVRLIIFDEMHHVVEGHGPKTAYEAVEVLKMLLLQARVQIVCVGLGITETILDVNPELPRHCRGRIKLMPLRCEPDNPYSDLLQFLQALKMSLPFDHLPNLTSSHMARRLHCGSGGFVGHMTNLIQAATQRAIELGLETLSLDVLEETYHLIEGASNQENPFSSLPFDNDRCSAIQKAFTRRRRRLWMRPTPR